MAKTRQRKLHKRVMLSGLNREQKDFVLRCLACNFSYRELAEEFVRAFGKNAPSHQSVTGYKVRHAEEIARRAEDYEKDIKSSGIPFVRKAERVARYARYVGIEDERKRFGEAAKHMHAIAEETGDLKQQHEHSGKLDVEDLSAQQRIDRLAELAGTIAARAGICLPDGTG